MLRRPLFWALAALVPFALSESAAGFRAMGSTWPPGQRVMVNLHLGAALGGFLDGSTGSWDDLASSAVETWNQYVDTIQFTGVPGSPRHIGDGNFVNNVLFADKVLGQPFPPNILAVTVNWSLHGVKYEADVVFNSAVTWNSYRGERRPGTTDFRRVALHEFGHLMGLDHPNEFGQSVNAIMNSRISDLDAIVADDVSGAQALYAGGAGATISFPPRNESIDFRRQLEELYRDQLRAAPTTTHVDLEGSIVWTSEYLRYRVGRCSHQSAGARVFFAIDDAGVYGLCGFTTAAEAAFPPRNESLAFRNQLEAKYRDQLRRPPTTTFVDYEGDAIWIQEYLRYRLSGCSHGDAASKVVAQISGLGIQPVCR